jgi:hypothetical protein
MQETRDFLMDAVELDGVLMHHGIKGQKWGVRRFQNSNGSLTPAGVIRYLGTRRKEKTTAKLKKLGVENPKSSDLTNAYKYGTRAAAKIAKAKTAKEKKRIENRALLSQYAAGMAIGTLMALPYTNPELYRDASRAAHAAAKSTVRTANLAKDQATMWGQAFVDKMFSKMGAKVGDVIYTQATEAATYLPAIRR